MAVNSVVAAPHTPARGTAGTVRAWAEAAAFVTGWVMLGFLLHLDANTYLVLGVPLTIAFQLGVRRRPLRELWSRDAIRPRLRTVAAVAVLLMIVPVFQLVDVARTGDFGLVAASCLAVLGAVPAAWAVAGLGRQALRAGLPAAIGAVAVGVTVMLLPLLSVGPAGNSRTALIAGLLSLAYYLPVVFVLEEVAFRGLLDTHVHPRAAAPGRGRGGWPSAVFVSVLWGLWHLPLQPGLTAAALPGTVLSLVIVHTAIGVLLSRSWRRSGSLVLPGAAHALVDAVRNAVAVMIG